MLAGAINLLDDTGKPAPPDELRGLADNLQALEPILEQEMNTVNPFVHSRTQTATCRTRTLHRTTIRDPGHITRAGTLHRQPFLGQMAPSTFQWSQP